MGCSTPNTSVNFVVIVTVLSPFRVSADWRFILVSIREVPRHLAARSMCPANPTGARCQGTDGVGHT
jgi:hypothetical protein